MSKGNPMENILEQMQQEGFSHAPGEEMTHVAGVSFVDNVGLSLGAAPQEEAGHAGTYRHIANCANELETLVLHQEEWQERQEHLESGQEGGQGQGQGHEHDDFASYQNYQSYSSGGGGHHQLHHHSSGHGAHSSTRLRGDDRHIVIERNSHNEVAAVVLQKKPEHDSEEVAGEEGEDTSS